MLSRGRLGLFAAVLLAGSALGASAAQSAFCFDDETTVRPKLVYVNQGARHRAWLHLIRDTVGTGEGVVRTGGVGAPDRGEVFKVPEGDTVVVGLVIGTDSAIWVEPGSPGPPPYDNPGLRFRLCLGGA